jgi:hypothetical protein
MASVSESMTRMKGTTPEVLPFMPTFSPIDRRLPQYEPMPPPRARSQTFSFHRPDDAFERIAGLVQEAGDRQAALVPPLLSTRVAA